MCGDGVLPLSEEGRLSGLEDNFWYHHFALVMWTTSVTKGDQYLSGEVSLSVLSAGASL
jgi:hypothetical protein